MRRPFFPGNPWMEDILQTTILLLGVALFAIAAYGDIKTCRIPNLLVASVAILGVLRLLVIGDLNAAIQTVTASVIVLIVVFLLFWRNFVGGGDAKLTAAAALLVGSNSLFNFLVLMSLCGLFVTIVVLVTQSSSVVVPSDENPLPKSRLAIPYGVAIAGGGIVTLLFQPTLLG
jgi:prepilin peptidase CpaA